MALREPGDWKGKWIGDGSVAPRRDEDFFRNDPAPLVRTEFIVEKPVRRARLYVTGLGYYDARLNDAAVGDRVLDPAWTTYSKRVLYSIHDVTGGLVHGRNCLGLILGNGWYNPLPMLMWDRLNLRRFSDPRPPLGDRPTGDRLCRRHASDHRDKRELEDPRRAHVA